MEVHYQCAKCKVTFKHDLGGVIRRPGDCAICGKCYPDLWKIAIGRGLPEDLLSPPTSPTIARSNTTNDVWNAVLAEFLSHEISCNICGRKNQSNVKSCWSCGNSPTKAKYKPGYVEKESFSIWNG